MDVGSFPGLEQVLLLACLGLALDRLFGDPVYPAHPVRLLGKALVAGENVLRRLKFDGRFGGFLLFLWLAAIALVPYFLLQGLIGKVPAPSLLGLTWLQWALDLFLTYSLFALGDLLHHARRVDRAVEKNDLPAARTAVGMLVGRDTHNLDGKACRRAAIESLAENFTDGVLAPLFWLWVGGVPGLIVFKIASTMDSMVGYRNERYLYFGWFGARLDDWLCWLPARLGFVLLCVTALFLPGCSSLKAWRIGWRQHGLIPGPNPGWAEATAAGALQVRLIGPLHKAGQLVTELWIGDAGDPEGGRAEDLRRMRHLVQGATVIALVSTLAATLALAWAATTLTSGR
jgi:adenosylcobinamide-phosphate synthase